MKTVIVGSGYVGLVTGTCFAEMGIEVTCVDIDQKKIENLKNGISPIYEPGLDEMIERNVAKKRLSFSTSLKDSLKDANIVFSAVGTPSDEDGSADLKYVLDVAKEVGENIEDYCLIVTKSTVPVGTAQKVKKAIQDALDKRGKKIDFDIASNPEFLKEGNAIKDFMFPDRIVVGVESERARDLMDKLYKPFTLNGHNIIYMD
ncbi:MAG: nucleotide sugar dehydrogenase, partial [Bacteroidales bacterium]|nr:nucleotide sugar dehydrogenase [Bacteroidales bacterium]